MASAQQVEDQAWVTLATNDTYALGALVLGHSLRNVGTTRRLVCMITPGVSMPVRNQLSSVFDNVPEVSVLDSRDTMNLDLLTRPDLGVTFTKLHCWRLEQYKKAIFLDADALLLKNCDELFDREELSAAPDAGWPDCFNSGVFVFAPSTTTYKKLVKFATTEGSFDGGDQGLLNSFFSDWATKDIQKHLPFIYNVVSQAFYSYLPAFKQFGDQVKIVHFIGPVKPWAHKYNASTGCVEGREGTGFNQDFLQMWWNIFINQVKGGLDPTTGGLVGELASLQISAGGGEGGASGGGDSPQYSSAQLNDRSRQYQWEQGQIEYTGIDAFENIQKKIDESLKKDPSPPKAAEAVPSTKAKPAAKPVAKPAAKPVAKPAAAPVAKPAAAPIAKPAPKPVAKPAAAPVAKPAPKPVAAPVAKPLAKPVATKPAVKKATMPTKKTA